MAKVTSRVDVPEVRMTRQHFQLIADILKANKPNEVGDTTSFYIQWEGTVLRFAGVLAHTNPGFKKDKFLEACGLPEDLLKLEETESNPTKYVGTLF